MPRGIIWISKMTKNYDSKDNVDRKLSRRRRTSHEKHTALKFGAKSVDGCRFWSHEEIATISTFLEPCHSTSWFDKIKRGKNHKSRIWGCKSRTRFGWRRRRLPTTVSEVSSGAMLFNTLTDVEFCAKWTCRTLSPTLSSSTDGVFVFVGGESVNISSPIRPRTCLAIERIICASISTMRTRILHFMAIFPAFRRFWRIFAHILFEKWPIIIENLNCRAEHDMRFDEKSKNRKKFYA